jgi:predicted Zn-dependent protease
MAKNDKNFWKTLTLEKFEDIIKNENHKQLDYDVINRITLHEIGHSLSLNHPFTSDGNLQNAKGVMGYNMTYNQIEDEEVIKIVKAYPNGFSLRTLPDSIKLDGLEVYIFPEGTASQKPDYAPVKILKTNGMNHLVNDGEYFEDIHVSMTHWDTFSKVLSVQFKVVKEFENADMVIVSHSVGGFEKQWFLDDIMTVEKALFSNLLLDIETTDYTYHLMGVNPNRILEEEQAFQHEQKQLYTEALAGCLKDKNMKKCNDEIAFEDFKQDKEDVPIWMPLTLMMK